MHTRWGGAGTELIGTLTPPARVPCLPVCSDLAPLMLLSMCLFMASFSLAMGPVCWIGTPEVFPTRIRAKVGR